MKKWHNIFFPIAILLIPVQFGKHFWPSFSYIYGIRVDYLSPIIYASDISILCLIITWVYYKKWNKQIFFSLNQAHILYGMFFLVLLLSIVFSLRPLVGLYGLLKTIEFVFFSIYIACNKPQKNNILPFLSCGIIAESFIAVLQYMKQSSIGGIFYYMGERTFNAETPGIANASIHGQLLLRSYGTFPHPNVLAAFLLIGMILILFHIDIKKAPSFFSLNTVFLFTLFMGTMALFTTMSRIVIVLWLICLCGVIARRAFLKTSVYAISSMTILLCLVFIFFNTPAFTRITHLSFSDESVQQRESLLTMSLHLIEKRPLTGVGLDNFVVALSEEKTHGHVFILQPVHNIYILVLTELGFFGFCLFIGILVHAGTHLYKVLKQNITKKKNNNFVVSIAVVYCGMIILGFFDHYFLTLQQGQLLFFFIMGLIWSVH